MFNTLRLPYNFYSKYLFSTLIIHFYKYYYFGVLDSFWFKIFIFVLCCNLCGNSFLLCYKIIILRYVLSPYKKIDIFKKLNLLVS